MTKCIKIKTCYINEGNSKGLWIQWLSSSLKKKHFTNPK